MKEEMPRTVVMDGGLIHGREDLHDILAEALRFPVWYGRNLDALYDCLTAIPGEVYVRIESSELLEAALGSYAVRLYHVLRDAVRQNPLLSVSIDGMGIERDCMGMDRDLDRDADMGTAPDRTRASESERVHVRDGTGEKQEHTAYPNTARTA